MEYMLRRALPGIIISKRYSSKSWYGLEGMNETCNALHRANTEAKLIFYCWYTMLKVVFVNTRVNKAQKHSDEPSISFDHIIVYYALKFSMTFQNLP